MTFSIESSSDTTYRMAYIREREKVAYNSILPKLLALDSVKQDGNDVLVLPHQ